MPEIDKEIAAYEEMKEHLESEYMGKWVLVHEGKLIAVFDEFEAAAEDSVKRFGRGPFLLRQVGAPPVSMPASVMYHPA